MFTDLIKRSKISARCYEIDIFEQMDDAREFMGVCPQHDSLQALRRCSMALLSVTELESCSLATELAVLTGLILPFY